MGWCRRQARIPGAVNALPDLTGQAPGSHQDGSHSLRGGCRLRLERSRSASPAGGAEKKAQKRATPKGRPLQACPCRSVLDRVPGCCPCPSWHPAIQSAPSRMGHCGTACAAVPPQCPFLLIACPAVLLMQLHRRCIARHPARAAPDLPQLTIS